MAEIHEFPCSPHGPALRKIGVGRDFENEHALLISFNRKPTDDELRFIDDLLARLLSVHPTTPDRE